MLGVVHKWRHSQGFCAFNTKSVTTGDKDYTQSDIIDGQFQNSNYKYRTKKTVSKIFHLLVKISKKLISICFKVLDRLHAKEENCKNLQTEIEDQHRKVSVIRHQVKIPSTFYSSLFVPKSFLCLEFGFEQTFVRKTHA